DVRGRQFAAYAHDGGPVTLPPQLSGDAPSSVIADDHITIVRPAFARGMRYGTLTLRIATASLTSRVHAYLWGLACLIVGVVFAPSLLGWALERLVSRRLFRLADVATQITRKEDYSLRVDCQGSDEIGQLGQAFNRMLVEIGHRSDQAQQAVRIRD